MWNISTISTGWAELEVGSMFGAFLHSARRKRHGRRLMASVYASRMLAFTLIPDQLGNIGLVVEAADGSVASIFARDLYPAGDIQGYHFARHGLDLRRWDRPAGVC